MSRIQKFLHGGAAKVVGRVDAGRFRTVEDAVRQLRLDAVVLGGSGIRWKAVSKGKRIMMRCAKCERIRVAEVEKV